MTSIFQQKERQIYYDQRIFIECVDELRASFKFYNPEVNLIGIKTLHEFFLSSYTDYIKEVSEVQKKTLAEIQERLIYANQNFNFDFEQCLKSRIEILKKNLNFQYLQGKRYAEFFAEMAESEQDLPKIVFPKGYERETFPSLSTNPNKKTKKKIVYKGEEGNRDELELMSLDDVKSPLEVANPKTMEVQIRGTLLGYNVKDKVVLPKYDQEGGEEFPPENIEINNRVFELVEKMSNMMEIKNYKFNLPTKSNGTKYLLPPKKPKIRSNSPTKKNSQKFFRHDNLDDRRPNGHRRRQRRPDVQNHPRQTNKHILGENEAKAKIPRTPLQQKKRPPLFLLLLRTATLHGPSKVESVQPNL